MSGDVLVMLLQVDMICLRVLQRGKERCRPSWHRSSSCKHHQALHQFSRPSLACFINLRSFWISQSRLLGSSLLNPVHASSSLHFCNNHAFFPVRDELSPPDPSSTHTDQHQSTHATADDRSILGCNPCSPTYPLPHTQNIRRPWL